MKGPFTTAYQLPIKAKYDHHDDGVLEVAIVGFATENEEVVVIYVHPKGQIRSAFLHDGKDWTFEVIE
jgi:hypothetical protein